MLRGFVGAGNFIVDYVKTIDVFPAEQTLANIHREYSGSGGAPYNVLLNLAKLGATFPLSAVGRIGDDKAGESILDDCAAHGIDTTRLLVTPEAPTSYTLVMVAEGSGKRTFFHQRGANSLLTPADFDVTGCEGSHLHFGYLLLLDAMDDEDAEYGTAAARVLAKAKEAGLTVSVDLVSEDGDRFGRIVPPALKHADMAFMNEFEATRATGVPLTERGAFCPGRVGEAHRSLEFAGTLVLHWADGAAACLPDGRIAWQGSVQMPRESIASVAGSGDAFAAGYLLGHLRGESTQDCLRLGVCCAAACVTGYTCTDAVLPEAACLALGDRFGFRSCP